MICVYCGFDGVEDGHRCPLCSRAMRPIGASVEGGLTESMESPAPDASSGITTGSVFAGAYRVESVLGRGGMGTVYRVTEIATGRPLALKLLHRQLSDVEEATVRFQRETAILARLDHPAIPKVFGSGLLSGQMYLVTELVDGEDLRAIIRSGGPMKIDQAIGIAADVADALEAAHERGVIHRDVKPHNIMVGEGGRVRLLDFGVARQVGINMQTITITGMILGTPEYMSPEQFEAHRVDGRCDIYSLGVVLFEMLTGRLPFEGDTPMALAIQHMRTSPPQPREIRPELPAWLCRSILRCLEKTPSARFPTAADFAADLRRPHDGRSRTRKLPTGDVAVEDESGGEWALILRCPGERRDWVAGMALRYRDEYFRLEMTSCEAAAAEAWSYHFSRWPAGEVFRKFVDYAEVGPVRPSRRKLPWLPR